MTAENGALASDYVDVADLIVYPMHTGAPGRTGDIAEIRMLLAAKKRLVVVITQCDRVEEDEGPGGAIIQSWVMKDPSARQGQVDYVRRAIAAGGDATPIDFITLSVRFAETHGNDSYALESSGVADLYRLLTNIARSEGVGRKCDTPSLNLDRFVDLVSGGGEGEGKLSVQHVLGRLDEVAKKAAAASVHIDYRAEAVKARVLDQIGSVVDKAIKAHAADRDQKGFESACSEALLEIVCRETENEVKALMVASGKKLPAAEFPTIAPILKLKQITIMVPRSNRKRTGAVGGAVGEGFGMWGGAVAGAAAGSAVPIVGNVIGGIVGAILGSLMGGSAGTAAGRALGSDWEESMNSCEDNRAAVAASAVEALQAAGSATVTDFFVAIKAAAIAPVDKRAKKLRLELKRLSKTLQGEVHSNG